LEAVHHGRVKARCPLHPESGGDEDEVQKPEIGFLVPWLGVGLRNARQPGVDVLFFGSDDRHCLLEVIMAKNDPSLSATPNRPLIILANAF
jgi:hypothetical protein